MESLGLALFANVYEGRRVLLTGHTGFKGSWLAFWLSRLGARLSCLALDPSTSPNHWDLLQLNADEHRCDIRDAGAVARSVAAFQPDVVFHLAAQPLVRASYRDPLATWSTNVMGTANVLQACTTTPSVRAIVVITSDKCYHNRETLHAYRETDRLGGHDPYSASKAATELVVDSYRNSFFSTGSSPLLASARAGNVIGGGDWSEDRLIPDLMRAVSSRGELEIRSPHAVRPWQHVLDSLSGYLLLGQKLFEGGAQYAGAWNFGPDDASNRPVAEVLTIMASQWPELRWTTSAQPQPHEATLLCLDSSKARQELGWQPVWPLDAALGATTEWYQRYFCAGGVASADQLDRYVAAAREADVTWSRA